jgi:hypothetical protein
MSNLPTNTLKFNTGRTYSAAGQRIAATLLDNGDIVFLDIDRSICGTIGANGLTIEDIKTLDCFTQRAIMGDYDANRYTDASTNNDLAHQLRQLANTVKSI